MNHRQSTTLSAVAVGAEYTPEEIEFIRAMESYMSRYHKRFPSFTEVLRVARSLGYSKPTEPAVAHVSPTQPARAGTRAELDAEGYDSGRGD